VKLRVLAPALLIFVALGLVVPQQPKQKDDKKPATPLAVKLNVIVTDSKLKFVKNLSQDQFRVFEDEVLQSISTFQPAWETGAHILAIDTSLSMRNEGPNLFRVAKLFVMSLEPENELEIIRFISSDKINTEAAFTSDKVQLIKAIEKLYLEGGQSAIIDATYLANDDLEKHTKDKPNVRRSLILITDGDERASYYKQEQLFKRLHETGTQVFAIGFTRAAANRPKAENFLRTLALESGGDFYEIGESTDLEQVIRQIVLEVKAPYVIGYQPANQARDGTFRKVRVEVARPTSGDNLSAFARKGYVATRK
jgi:Ca-activated chloride channel homolog